MLVEELVFQLSRRRLRSALTVPDTARGAVSSNENYQQWRDATLREEFERYFEPGLIRDRDVLDFGCGNGSLSFALVGLGAKSSTGVELSEKVLELARARLQGEPIRFVRPQDTRTIPLPDACIDVVVCFDVMEHIMEYEAILAEWRRVLRPGGRVLIHWQPWFHPYGHHAHGYVPIPWVHLLLDDAGMTRVCARIVQLPEFDPPWWDRDAEGRRINRFQAELDAGTADRNDYLNKLTMGRFEHLCGAIGLEIEKRQLMPFEGPALVRAVSRTFTVIPGVREFFTANAIYTLRKPAA